MRHIRVAVPVPALEALTYGVPDGTPTPVIGARVLVPLGKRTVTGVVTWSSSSILPRASQRQAEISDVLDADAFVPPRTSSSSRSGWPTTTRAVQETRSVRRSPPRAPGRDPAVHVTARSCRPPLTARAARNQRSGRPARRRRQPASATRSAALAGILAGWARHAGLARRGVSAATLKRLAGAGLVSFTRQSRSSAIRSAHASEGRPAARPLR